MSSVTFGNFTIISSTEGGWQEPEWGSIDPAYQMTKLLNADGELAIPLASGGTDHVINVLFVNRPTSAITTILERIKALKTKGVQSLQVPEWPPVPNCIFVSAKRTNLRTGNYSVPSGGGGTLTIEPRRNLGFALTFRQLFE